MYDLHPLVIHFPVAFLTIYALLEFARLKSITNQPYWFYLKAVTATIGALGGVVAAQFGEFAEDAYRGTDTMRVIEMHSAFADATNIIAGVITALYILAWLNKTGTLTRYPWGKKLTPVLEYAERITASRIMIILALLALVAISVTGALGGSIVYGKNSDPIAAFISDLLIK